MSKVRHNQGRHQFSAAVVALAYLVLALAGPISHTHAKVLEYQRICKWHATLAECKGHTTVIPDQSPEEQTCSYCTWVAEASSPAIVLPAIVSVQPVTPPYTLQVAEPIQAAATSFNPRAPPVA
jgi:hypothetical protein